MKALLKDIRQCTVCEEFLTAGCRPILAASHKSRVLVIGQAPGRIVHEKGVPWDDRSGENLRKWMGISGKVFYNPEKVALIPMGFCYPGTGKSGDLPPRKECAPLWHVKLLEKMPNVRLTLLIGSYAQGYYLHDRKKNLTETVKSWREYLPEFLPLPHPSPRNNIWQKKNPWFAVELVPEVKRIVKAAIR